MSFFSDMLQPLQPGDTIGIAAPAACFNVDLFQKGLDALRAQGFQIHAPQAIYRREGYLGRD